MTEQPLPYTIEIDRDVCMGSGLCEVYAAATFEVDEKAKATVVDPAGDPLERIRVAVEACPTGAITIRET